MSAISEEVEAMLQEGLDALKAAEATTRERMKKYAQMFKEAAALILPVDATKLLEKGGIIATKVLDIDYSPGGRVEGPINVLIGSKDIFEYNDRPIFRPRVGQKKVRVVLILEPLEDKT